MIEQLKTRFKFAEWELKRFLSRLQLDKKDLENGTFEVARRALTKK
jgi:hypothetical protein